MSELLNLSMGLVEAVSAARKRRLNAHASISNTFFALGLVASLAVSGLSPRLVEAVGAFGETSSAANVAPASRPAQPASTVSMTNASVRSNKPHPNVRFPGLDV
jgi:hypothetical protein